MGDILTERTLEFDFSSADRAVRFDGETHRMSHCMKSVDFLVEWSDEFWFVEVKDPSDPDTNFSGIAFRWRDTRARS